MNRSPLALSLLLALPAVMQGQSNDIAFVNARVWTVDATKPRAEAVAVRNGRIVAVGSNDAIRALASSTTRVIDCGGRLMLPGFIDNHTHFMSGGFQLQSVDLRGAKNEREFAAVIGQRAASKPGRWITGGDWDHDAWPGAHLPTRQLIDSITAGTPVFVSRYDGHMALANSAVLALAGIDRNTPDPPGGMIVRDPRTGEATGVLKDEAMAFVWKLIPDPTAQEMLEAARLALTEARKFGLTSIQDVSSSSDVDIYRKLLERGELTARFHCRLPLPQWKSLAENGIKAATGNEWIRLGSLKAFADGSLGSTTALFTEPYLSDPSTKGLATDIVMDGRMEQWASAADNARLQLSIHAIGDSANALMLDMFERITKSNPSWDRRFRIEHAQHIRPVDFSRFKQLGVIASVQPYHAIDDGRWAEGRIGTERCRTTYPFKSFLDAGVTLSFGSDWTVGPLDPIAGIYAAVTRRTTDGAHPGGWIPEQKISVDEAIRAYTLNNAYAAFEEQEKGSITPGKLADMVLISDDLFTIPPEEIVHSRVVMTVLGGAIVYSSL